MTKQAIDPALIRNIIIDTDGATCSNCSRALEHIGPKLEGVQTLEVARDTNEISLAYDGKPETLESVVKLVEKLGYNATPRKEAVSAV